MSWLLKTHADPSLLLRMTVWVIAFSHRVSAHHGQPERLSMLRMTASERFSAACEAPPFRQPPKAFQRGEKSGLPAPTVTHSPVSAIGGFEARYEENRVGRDDKDAPSPPALGAPRPRRLMKALVAAHPLPKGEGRNQQSRPAPLGRGRKSSPGGWAGPALPNGRPTRRTVQRLVPLYCRQEITDVL